MQIQIKSLAFRAILFFVFTCFSLCSGVAAYGQKVNTDSLRRARQHTIDSAAAARKQVMDSARIARQHTGDSMRAARKRVTDSLATIKKYRESKRFKDSVANVRKERLDSIKLSRTAYFDSLKAARQRVTDSLIALRKQSTDSIRLVQKARADSLAAIRKYRESKRYKDSVLITRQQRLDSMRLARKTYNDSVFAERKKITEEANAKRKASADSLAAIRKQTLDSMKAVRKVRTDSLAKVREDKERLAKSREKLKSEKMQLALELKIKKKHQAWSNEKMLKKKWSVLRRPVQNTFTHYNYFFNADKKMDEALANMLRMRKENYDSLLALYPFDPDRDSASLASDMDTIIQKASLGIQIHDPRTKWADDLYLLLGEAYYYKGHYDDAATAFRYIIAMNQLNKTKAQKEASQKSGRVKAGPTATSIVQPDKKKMLDFLERKPVNNEAVLWLSRTYTEAHREDDAESILDLLDNDKDLPESLKGRVALEKAYLNLSRENYKAASEQLAIVADDNHLPGWTRMRAAYLNGQLLTNQGNYDLAASHFQKVIDMKPKIDLDFYARKNLAYSRMYAGGDQKDAIASLKRLLNDGKYAPYYEQVYYVLGNLAANGGNVKDAEVYLKKSIASPKSTKKQKALSFASLGNVYYNAGNYQRAKLVYDSASLLAKYAPNDSLIELAVKRNTVLDQIAGPFNIIHDQDSLLSLAAMTDKEQRSAVRKYIRMLEDRRADSAFRAENGEAPKQQEEEAPGVNGSIGSWYFSNTALMQQGLNEFKRKWGNRPNVDNWRRAGGTFAANSGGAAAPDEAGSSSAVDLDENGLPTESSLLAAIPKTEADKQLARQKIQKAYIDLGNVYVKQLQDYPPAIKALDTLDKRFPDHEHKAEALYLRYLIALREDHLPEAQQIGQQLQQQYPATEWAKLIAPPSEDQGLLASTSAVPVSNYYDETYGLMMQRDYGAVLQRVRAGQRQYKDPVFNNRFRIMEAIALAGSGNYDQADTLLTEFLSTHPSDSLRTWADAVLKYIGKNKPVAAPAAKDSSATAAPGTLKAAQPASVAGTATAAPPAPPVAPTSPEPPPPANYAYNPREEHYVIFAFSKVESRTMGVKVALADFNTFNYKGQGLTSSLEVLSAQKGLVVIKKFPNAAAAKAYMNAARGNSKIFREYKPAEYQSFLISGNNYRKLVADKDTAPYMKFYSANY